MCLCCRCLVGPVDKEEQKLEFHNFAHANPEPEGMYLCSFCLVVMMVLVVKKKDDQFKNMEKG